MKRLMNMTRVNAIALAIAVALPPSAWAQSNELEEIVVTARKRDESVFEIPLSVTAFSQESVDALGINTLENLSNFTPGFQFQNVGQGGRGGRQNPNIRFRGVGVQNENPSSRAGAVFWDGTYLSDGAGILPLIDLERVEVIKGPQNAYFGRNTFAGAVNYVPALPGDELNGKVLASYSGSDEDSYNITAAIGGPITSTIGARVGLMTERVGADYTYRNGEPIGEEDTQAATFVGTWNPTEEFFLKVSALLVESEDTRTSVSQVAPVPAGDCNRVYSGQYRSLLTGQITGSFTTDLSQSPRALFCGSIPDWDTIPPNTPAQATIVPGDPLFLFNFANTIRDYQDLPAELDRRNFYVDAPDGLGNTYRLWRYNVSFDYDLPNDHVLSAAFARGESVSRGIFDNNFGTPSPIFGGNPWLTGVATWVRDTFAEIRLTSGSDQRLRYMIGVSKTEQDNNLAEYSAFGAPIALNFESGDNLGVFGSLDYDVNEKVTLSVEGRWNDDEQIVLYDGTEGVDPDPIANLGRSYSAFMPRFIVAYQPTDTMNLYASYSKSFLQGDFTNAQDYYAALIPPEPVPPGVGNFTPRQELEAIEIGIKHQANDWLNYSVAAYTMEWKNQVFFELSPFFVATYAPGTSDYVGLDMEAQITPTNWLTLSGNAAYVDVELTDFSGTGSVAGAVLDPTLSTRSGEAISAIGNRPRYIAEWTGSFSAEVAINELMNINKRVFARLDGVYQGDFFVDNFEYNEVAGYWRFNMRAGMDVTDNLSVEVYGNNITDDLSWSAAGGDTSITGSPDRKTFGPLPRRREIGLRFLANF